LTIVEFRSVTPGRFTLPVNVVPETVATIPSLIDNVYVELAPASIAFKPVDGVKTRSLLIPASVANVRY